MTSTDHELRDRTRVLDDDIEAALNPGELQGFHRDTRECAALALQAGKLQLLLAPPAPRPKKKG
ncbi:hypothetical protein E2C00_03185 [Streptomyces sp. WAC05374]|uniref:hypothetical protein n=1 Tax=unclassified Streptomyces TaxID=2593676 RepID=UPI000F893943|nr:hypothetical protein [Streptomyces sp. WAC05374]RST02730.1 hypothetical protein EF905_34595 [Streptomyces sp. WAC05374]TDF50503.1 hypothetical protein E2B92_03165 [Streptomyces sp. WAC05374]TDF51871.1 hypothetical protein E2C02_23350 [Streptomyces sp. WAC05374]TDF60757.1 hypothetical protein E2C00_03185 [Streptomyces sp. WAC05374]